MTKNQYMRFIVQAGETCNDVIARVFQDKSKLQKAGITQEQASSILSIIKQELAQSQSNFISYAEKQYTTTEESIVPSKPKKKLL